MHVSTGQLSAGSVCLAILAGSGIVSAGHALRRGRKSLDIVPLAHDSLMLNGL